MLVRFPGWLVSMREFLSSREGLVAQWQGAASTTMDWLRALPTVGGVVVGTQQADGCPHTSSTAHQIQFQFQRARAGAVTLRRPPIRSSANSNAMFDRKSFKLVQISFRFVYLFLRAIESIVFSHWLYQFRCVCHEFDHHVGESLTSDE